MSLKHQPLTVTYFGELFGNIGEVFGEFDTLLLFSDTRVTSSNFPPN